MNYHDHLVNIGIGTENAKLNLTKAGQKGIFLFITSYCASKQLLSFGWVHFVQKK
jgi:hypothetical protein